MPYFAVKDANGDIIIRVTGTGPYTVKGYTAAGGSGEVFAAAAGAVGDTVAISASSSSSRSPSWRPTWCR